jgi:hypothetical protein
MQIGFCSLPTISAAFLLLFCAVPAQAQVASSTSIVPTEKGIYSGDVVIKVNGRQKTLAHKAWKAWRIEGGKTVLWAGSDGSGGHEGEGQSLWRFDVATGKRTKLLSEYEMIDEVREIRSSSGKPALLVRTSDSAAGIQNLILVHPTRGGVWQEGGAALRSLKNGKLTVAVYKDSDNWAVDYAAGQKPPIGKPERVYTVDIDAALKRPALPHKKHVMVP